MARGTFRQDLFFRINGITLSIPSLRERVAEISELARQFLEDAETWLERALVAGRVEDVLNGH